jgi:uncharacterized membrane protein
VQNLIIVICTMTSLYVLLVSVYQKRWLLFSNSLCEWIVFPSFHFSLSVGITRLIAVYCLSALFSYIYSLKWMPVVVGEIKCLLFWSGIINWVFLSQRYFVNKIPNSLHVFNCIYNICTPLSSAPLVGKFYCNP